jgi:hypothetical protein
MQVCDRNGLDFGDCACSPDAGVDAPEIDAPEIDAPEIDAPEIDAPALP